MGNHTQNSHVRRNLMAGKHSSRKWKKRGKCRWKTRKKKLRRRRAKAKRS
ncbi:MAG: hypothetical protein ACE5PM_05180 [Candidatus Hydrothermarchaeales archaeon]